MKYQGLSKYFFLDLLNFSLSIYPVVLAIGLTAQFFNLNIPFLIQLLFAPLVLTFIFLFIIFLLKLFTPKLRPGTYDIGLNKGFIAWYCNTAIERAIEISCLKKVLYSSYLLRFLLFKALRAKIHFTANTSITSSLHDLELIEIGKNTTLSEEVRISAHILTDKKIILKSVSIGNDSFIGSKSEVIAGARIGSNCFIGSMNKIHRRKIDEESKIENYKYKDF